MTGRTEYCEKRLAELCFGCFRADRGLLREKLLAGLPADAEFRAVRKDIELIARLCGREVRFNPNHDPANGRFTSGPGGTGGLTDEEICAKIVKELKSTNFIGDAHYPPKKIDADRLLFDDEHINAERKHGVTEKEAKDFIRNARISVTKNRPYGIFENYYGNDGAAYVDIKRNCIRTSYKKSEFNNAAKRLLDVVDKCEKEK